MKRFKEWCKRTWRKFKTWLAGIFTALTVLFAVNVEAVNIIYTAATEYEDGTALPIEQIAETRLYCNGELLTSEPGADGSFDNVEALLPAGTSQCYGTHVSTNGKESQPSNIIDVIVISSSAPNPPVLDP